MRELLSQIKACDVCRQALPHPPRPVMAAGPHSKIVIIGQAPGSKVHASGIPWADQSGDLLRAWLGIGETDFYDPAKIALIPMGFCYPGTGKSGDLPPRPECAPLWHPQLFEQMTGIRLTLLIGHYAQRYYLGDAAQKNLTETVRNFAQYLPDYFALPHPSPRNRFWLRKNPWFQQETLPVLKKTVQDILGTSNSTA